MYCEKRKTSPLGSVLSSMQSKIGKPTNLPNSFVHSAARSSREKNLRLSKKSRISRKTDNSSMNVDIAEVVDLQVQLRNEEI